MNQKAKKAGGEHASQERVLRVLARGLLEIAAALDIKLDQDIHRIANGRRLWEASIKEH